MTPPFHIVDAIATRALKNDDNHTLGGIEAQAGQQLYHLEDHPDLLEELELEEGHTHVISTGPGKGQGELGEHRVEVVHEGVGNNSIGRASQRTSLQYP